MGQQQSKDELLYQQVSYGNTEGIKALCRDGARLEWMDREGKTPLIVACMNPDLHNVAKTLIELGANVNAYRPGRHAGTPLHHAAKRGLENTVKLLLLHGANALVMNDDCQSPLDVARAKGHGNVVRAIESHICLFSGWMREFYGPGFLEVLVPQLLARKVWVLYTRDLAHVNYSFFFLHPRFPLSDCLKNEFRVLPNIISLQLGCRITCGTRNHTKPFKLELAIYPSVQDAQPRTVVALWKANLEEPKSHQSDPSVIIVENTTRGGEEDVGLEHLGKHALNLHPNEGDKQQLLWFCNACKGIPQAHPAFMQHNNETPVVPATAPPATEDLEIAMAINASIQSAIQERPPFHDAHLSSEASTSNTKSSSMNTSSHSHLGAPKAPVLLTGASEQPGHAISTSGILTQHTHIQEDSAAQISHPPDSGPSAPLITDGIVEDGPIHYPSIDSSPIDISSPTADGVPARVGDKKGEEEGSSTCIICLDAPVEGACIPCGHMAGCMSCLNEIKAAKGICPVCRAKIHQVIKLYAV
ncbi:hypothetical protein FNV43_RR01426 [Rhamnella rubrinervis]|uniref:RING-type domain-containing protein n=1 Tax=Rhamnella rubrinervis TaxID=2594499 RepID=A0A8K0MS98_9ROSA|nr:hypothetical protein FNV43_RR01426 [Rhamnella rubrinervis]